MIAPLVLALFVVQAQHAPTRAGSEPLAPALEQRVQALGNQLRCAVCQGLSIADSPSAMARAQLDTVRALVAEGKTDAEIRDYFIARYGEWALLSPPAHGFNWVVWLGPAVVIALGLLVILRLFRNAPEQAAAAVAAAETPEPLPSDDPYLRAVRAEVER